MTKSLQINDKRPFCAAIRSALVWPTALAALAFATYSWAEDAHKGTVPERRSSQAAILQNPPWRFGAGFPWLLPDTALPDNTRYLENQLQAFIEHRRTNNVMFNVAFAEPVDGHGSCRKFQRPQSAATRRRIPATSWRQAEKSSRTGCGSRHRGMRRCHGPDAAGTWRIPRLAGQRIPTSSTNWSIGAKNAAKIQKCRTHRQS